MLGLKRFSHHQSNSEEHYVGLRYKRGEKTEVYVLQISQG